MRLLEKKRFLFSNKGFLVIVQYFDEELSIVLGVFSRRVRCSISDFLIQYYCCFSVLLRGLGIL